MARLSGPSTNPVTVWMARIKRAMTSVLYDSRNEPRRLGAVGIFGKTLRQHLLLEMAADHSKLTTSSASTQDQGAANCSAVPMMVIISTA